MPVVGGGGGASSHLGAGGAGDRDNALRNVNLNSNFDPSSFSSETVHDDLQRTVEGIRGLQRQFTLPAQMNDLFGQIWKQMSKQGWSA